MLACFLRYHRILRGPGGNSEASAYIEHTLSNYGADECVAHAETKDHLNWESIGLAAKREKGDIGKALKKAYEEVEDEVYEHLYHYNKGWSYRLARWRIGRSIGHWRGRGRKLQYADLSFATKNPVIRQHCGNGREKDTY